MTEFLGSLGNVGWWLSVVFVGLALNILSNYLYKWIDRAGTSFSSRISARSAKKIEAFNREVSSVVAQPSLVPYYFHTEIRLRLQAIQFLIFATIFALFPLLIVAPMTEVEVTAPAAKVALRAFYSFLMLASALSVLMGYRSMLNAMRIRSILNKSRIALGIV